MVTDVFLLYKDIGVLCCFALKKETEKNHLPCQTLKTLTDLANGRRELA